MMNFTRNDVNNMWILNVDIMCINILISTYQLHHFVILLRLLLHREDQTEFGTKVQEVLAG